MILLLLLQDWSQAGLPPVPERTRVVEVQGDPQEAIDQARPDDILFLPEGIYDGLRLRSRITLRGAGPGKTILKGSIHVGSGGADWWYPNRLKVDVQGKRGVEALRGDASKLKIGMMVQLARGDQRQVTRIVSLDPLRVSPAPLFDLPEGSRLAPAGRVAEFVGIEDLALEGSGPIGISMTAAYGCWIRNVSVRNFEYANISLGDALHCEIRRCFIASGAAGIRLGTSSFCKIEDNVLADQSPQVELTASTANVIAYNYGRDSEIYGVVGPSINVAQASSFNLYEGNVAQKIQVDGGSHETVFRNRLRGMSVHTPKLWICVNLTKAARDCSILGNVLGAPGKDVQIYAFGDPDARQTAILKGNFNWKDAKVPEAEGVEAFPPSLYLKSKPAGWGDLSWPPFGPDVPHERNKIPAEARD